MNGGNMQGMMSQRGGAAVPQQISQNNRQQLRWRSDILHRLQNEQQQIASGWRKTLDPTSRLNFIQQVASALRILKQTMLPESALKYAMQIESQAMEQSPDQAAYEATCTSKLNELHNARQKQAPEIESQLRNAQNAQNAQMTMGQQIHGQNMNLRPGQLPQNFANPQMQNAMQNMNMQNQQQSQQSFNQHPQNLGNMMMAGSQPQMQHGAHVQNINPNVPRQMGTGLTMEEMQQVQIIAQQLRTRATPEEFEQVKANIQSAPIEQKQKWQQQGMDPIMVYYRQHASRIFLNKKKEVAMQRQRQQQQQQHQQQVQATVNLGMTTGPQQGLSMPQNAPGNALQQFAAVSAGQGYNSTFSGTMQNFGNILGLQQDALRSQERGQVVVPVSGNPNNPQQPPQGLMQATMQQNSMSQPNPTRTNFTAQQLMAAQEKMQQDARVQAHARGALQGQIPPEHNLQGQAGGLNSSMGQTMSQQSPAMPNLNRPLGPSMPMTQHQGPIQNRPQVPPSQLAPNNAMTGNPHTQQLQAFLATLPPEMQQKYQGMSQEQKIGIFQSYMKQSRTRQPQMPQTQIGRQIPVHTPGPVAQNFNTFNPNVSQPQDGSQGMQGRGFEPHPQPQVPQQPLPARNPQNPPILNAQQVAFMDAQAFPPNMINAQDMHRLPPQGVRLWRELKSWVQQNMPEEILTKLKNLQAMHYVDYARKILQQRQAGNAPGQPVHLQQTGPAPQAQMLQARGILPPTQMGMGVSMPLGMPVNPPPSAAQLQQIRAQYPEMRQLSDENLRAHIIKVRIAEQYKMQQARNAQAAQFQQHQKQNFASSGQNVQGQSQKPPTPGQQPAAHPGTPLKVQDTPLSHTPHTPVRVLTQNQLSQKGLKRSNDDSVSESPNSKPRQPQLQQRKVDLPRKQAAPSQKPQGLPQAQQQQQQQQQSSQYEAELRNQAARTDPMQQGSQKAQTGTVSGAPHFTTEQQKAAVMEKYNEIERGVSRLYHQTPHQEVQMDPVARSQMVAALEKYKENLKKATQATRQYYFLTRDQKRTEELIRLRLPIMAQYQERNEINNKLTLSLNDLHGAFQTLFQAMKAAHDDQQLANQQRMLAAKSSASASKDTSTSSPQVAPNMNGKSNKQQAPLQKNQAHRNNRAPAAPTQDKPPFSFNHVQSPPPDGVPVYGPNSFPPDKLSIPPGKRRKVQSQTGGSATTPSQTQGTPSSTASPKLSKSTSPRLPRSTAPVAQFKCSEESCERSAKGFATIEERDKHVQEAHQVKETPITNPLEWALESMRTALVLDDNGRAKKREIDTKIDKLAPTAQPMKKSASTQSLTPMMKMEGGTPMSRIPTQTGIQSGHGQPRTPQQTGSMVKTPGSDVKSSVQRGGSYELERSASTRNQPLTPPPDAWADLTISPRELSQYFPSAAKLQGCSSLSSLTPDSTLSGTGTKSQDNSPKESDIAETDGLKIQIEMEHWLPPVFLADSLFPQSGAQLGADDDLLGMDWGAAFGVDDAKANDTSFDISLFSFEA